MGLIHIQDGYELVIPVFEAPKQPGHSGTLSLTTSDSLGGFWTVQLVAMSYLPNLTTLQYHVLQSASKIGVTGSMQTR